MGKWDDRVRGHAVHGTITAVLTALEGLRADRVEMAPEDVERLVWIVGHVQERLDCAPGMAVPQQTLDQLNGQLVQINTEIANFASNGNTGHLVNANNYADSMLEQARVLPPLSAKATARQAESYLKRVGGLVSTVVAEVDADRARLREAVEATRQASEVATQMATTSEQVAQLEAQAQQQAAKLEQTLSSQQEQFARDQDERAAAFDEAEQQRADAAEAAEKKAQEQFAARADELSGQAADTVQALTELRRQAEELVGAIGVAGVAAGYNETAQREERVADQWRWATVAVALVAVGVLVFALFIDHSAAGSWQRLASRMLVSLSFAGVAAYCGRESAAHRAVAREARARHLQLAALNPYLANMPSDDSVRLKTELAPGYFAPPAAKSGADSGNADDPGGPLVTKLLELLNTLATKGAGNRERIERGQGRGRRTQPLLRLFGARPARRARRAGAPQAGTVSLRGACCAEHPARLLPAATSPACPLPPGRAPLQLLPAQEQMQ